MGKKGQPTLQIRNCQLFGPQQHLQANQTTATRLQPCANTSHDGRMQHPQLSKREVHVPLAMRA